ncbi:MAG: hypothetical protein KDD61_13150, partial [Bdellovibrionales bacterium]|nr:hypothetical protein [Bdellovibrionales bacterium]
SSKNIADNIVNDGSNTFGQIREIASDTINKESQTADGVKESQWKEVEETDTSIDLAKDVVENSRNLPGEALTESPQLDASVQKEVKESNLTYDQARQVDNLLSNVRDNIGEVSNGETIPEIANNEISNEDVHKASKDETQQNSPETNQNQEPVRSTNSIRREIASDLVKDDSVHDQCKEPLAELLIVRAEINRKKRKIAGLQGNLKDLREEESKIKKERTQRKQKLQANNKDHRSDRKSLEEDRASNLVQKNKNNNSQSEKKGKKEEKENRFSEREKEKKEKNEHAQSDVHRQISSLQKDIDEKTKKYMTIRRDVKESNCESSYNKKLLQAKKNKGGRS